MRGALDLLVEYGPDRFVFEIQRRRDCDGLDRLVERGVAQTAAYLDSVGLTEGWLLIFDVRPGTPWAERQWSREVRFEGKTIRVRGT